MLDLLQGALFATCILQDLQNHPSHQGIACIDSGRHQSHKSTVVAETGQQFIQARSVARVRGHWCTDRPAHDHLTLSQGKSEGQITSKGR